MRAMWTTKRLLQGAAALGVAACSVSSPPEASAAEPPFAVTEVAVFESPWALDFLPGSGVPMTNTALLSEREGRLWLVDVATGTKSAVTGVPQAHVAGQGGLGDVVAHPDFAGNQRVYLSFVEPGPDGTSGAAVGYGRLILGQGEPRLEAFKVIWRQSPKVTGNGHFAHRIAFAKDGTMFVSSGDRQKMDPAQDLAGQLGKILHMTAEGAPLPQPQIDESVGPSGRDPFVWSYGHRNPLGIAFAPDGRLWSTEMGPQGGDELNLIEKGRNYGWPAVSYGSHYGGADIPDQQPGVGYAEPKAWWNPSISPGGLLIYTGDLFKGWKGDALIPALSGQALIRVDIDGDKATKANRWDMGRRIRAADQGPDGSIYLIVDERSGGKLLKLTPR